MPAQMIINFMIQLASWAALFAVATIMVYGAFMHQEVIARVTNAAWLLWGFIAALSSLCTSLANITVVRMSITAFLNGIRQAARYLSTASAQAWFHVHQSLQNCVDHPNPANPRQQVPNVELDDNEPATNGPDQLRGASSDPEVEQAQQCNGRKRNGGRCRRMLKGAEYCHDHQWLACITPLAGWSEDSGNQRTK